MQAYRSGLGRGFAGRIHSAHCSAGTKPLRKGSAVPEAYGKSLEVARALRSAGDVRQAFIAYSQLLIQYPGAAEAWVDYGHLLLSMSQWDDAAAAFSQALAIDANDLLALAGQARVHLKRGQLEEAAAQLDRLLAAEPGLTEARLDLARCRWKQGQLEQAKAALLPAVELDPSNQVVTSFLIDIFIRQKDWPELHKEMLRRAATDYAGAELEWELCCVNLLFGAMAEGWEQHESRWDHPGLTNPKREFPQPLWDGSALEGRTVLLHCEQGFGDTIMFVRYAPLVKALGGRVLLLAQPELADLVATCPGIDQTISEESAIPRFDVHLPLLSLPRIFQTSLATIPAAIPYLDVPERVPNQGAICERLAHSRGKTRIALSWAGNPTHARDSQRSIPPETFKSLECLPNVAWFAFQHGMTEVPPLLGIESMSPLLSNFSDTAYALSGMDLVITVDTALAHLAGALGIPTLLLVSYLPDWRWLMGRDDSPWYPSMQIYRQPLAGNWESVIHQIATDLAHPS